MAPFLVVLVLVGGVALMVFLRNQGRTQQAGAVVSFGGGMLGLIAFFGLPWMETSSLLMGIVNVASSPLALEQIKQRSGQPELVDQVFNLLKNVTHITGWTLTTAFPTVSDMLRLELYFLLAAACVALLGGMIGLSNSKATRLIGSVQIGVSVIAVLVLLFSLKSIHALGFEPTLIAPLLETIGLSTGIGVWIMLGSLIVNIVGGFLLLTVAPNVRKPTSRSYTPTRRPYR